MWLSEDRVVCSLGRRGLERYMREGFWDSVMSWGFLFCFVLGTAYVYIFHFVDSGASGWIFEYIVYRVEKASTAMTTAHL